MKNTKRLSCVLGTCAAIAAFNAVPAAAQDDTGMYLKLDGGANFLQQITVNNFGSEFKEDMDVGFRFDIMAGYNLNRYAGVEFETGFMYNEPKNVSDVWLGAVPVLGNLVLRYPNSTPFVPFVGIGAGGAFTLLDNGDSLENDFVFAYQLQGGLNYMLSEDMSLGFTYKYFATADQDYDGIEIEDVHNHFVGLNFSWNF
jgi:opacity protein-like surface antigen